MRRFSEFRALALRVDFETNTGARLMVSFTRKPMGMRFHTTAEPLTVAEVAAGSHAEKLGVTAGWKLVGVEDEDLSSMDAQSALAKLRRRASVLRSP